MTTTKTRKAARTSKATATEGAEALQGLGAPWKRKAVKGTAELASETLVSDTRGAAFVEYITLICVVILGGSAAVVSLGVPLVHMYRVAQLIVGLPIP